MVLYTPKQVAKHAAKSVEVRRVKNQNFDLNQKIKDTISMIGEPNKLVTFVEKNIIESQASKNISDIRNVFRIKKNQNKQVQAQENRKRL